MANNNFNYPIFPDRIYTLTYDGFKYKVSGETIISTFKDDAHLEHTSDELFKERELNDQLD